MQTDDSLENTPIDPFAPLESTEGFAFPPEEFHEQFKPVVLDENGEPLDIDVTKAERDSNGQLIITAQTDPDDYIQINTNPDEFHNQLKDKLETTESLAVVDNEPVSPDDITDTPQEPLAPPEEPETRVSLEEPEDYDQNANVLTMLNDVHDKLSAARYVTQDDVIAVESLVPSLITAKRPVSSFSKMPSVVGYDVSLENIASEIIERAKKLLGALVKRIKAWLGRYFNLSNLSEVDLEKEWKVVEATANRKDSVGDRNAFKKRYADTPAGKKAGNTNQFIRLHANDLISEIFKNNGNAGIAKVVNKNVSAALTAEYTKVNKLLDGIERAITQKLKDVQLSYPAVDDIAAEISTVNEANAARSGVKAIDFTKYVTLDTGWNDYVKFIQTTEKRLDAIATSIDSLSRSVKDSDIGATTRNVTELGLALESAKESVRLIKAIANPIAQFNSACTRVIARCKVIVTTL